MIWDPSRRGGQISEGVFEYANGRERQAKNVNGRGGER
jgi:hypothetical protein